MNSNRGLSTAAREAVADATKLARLEAQLLRERMKAEARRKGVAAGLGVSGVVFLLFAKLLLLFGAVYALDLLLPLWAAFLIVGGAELLLGGILLGASATGLRRSAKPGAGETVEQIKEDVRWVRERTS